MSKAALELVVPLIGESGEVYTIIVRGHVAVDEYQRIYADWFGYPRPETERIRHTWGRWIPVPRRSDSYPIKYFLHPAEPNTRGAFPYTENTVDLP